MKAKTILRTGAICGMTAVLLGAMGAHALQKFLDASSLARWDTANRYHMYHALALCAAAVIHHLVPGRRTILSARFFIAGIVLFSGSVYLFALKPLLNFDLSFLGPVTPIGGLCFMAGWLCLFTVPFNNEKTPTV